MQPKTIIFIGPQGSGKGTQIAQLKTALEENDHRRVVDIQTGRRFRALAASQETYAENKVADTMSSGQLQPDFLSSVLWGQAMINHLDPKSHLLIDGFPRTVGQIPDLEDAFVFFQRENIIIINIETPEDVVRQRMKARARKDDTEDSIEERLRWYREDTLPVMEYYRVAANVTVYDIDGTNTIEDVHLQIKYSIGL